MEVWIPYVKGQFWGLFASVWPIEKHCECAVVYAAKWIIQSSVTAQQAMHSFVKIL